MVLGYALITMPYALIRHVPSATIGFTRQQCGGQKNQFNPVNRACPVKSVFLFNWGLT